MRACLPVVVLDELELELEERIIHVALRIQNAAV